MKSEKKEDQRTLVNSIEENGEGGILSQASSFSLVSRQLLLLLRPNPSASPGLAYPAIIGDLNLVFFQNRGENLYQSVQASNL